MGPVYYTATWIVFIFAKEFDHIADFEHRDAVGEIDVVGDEQGESFFDFNEESLVLIADGIVGQNTDDSGFVADLEV